MITKEELDRAFDARFPVWMKEKLNAAHVAVAGLGGLGSNIAVMLARSGVGHLFLVDFDVVDVTNLNRQMYRTKDIGRPQPEALVDMLGEITPYLDIKTRQIKVSPDNVKELFDGYPIVCDAFDKPDMKSMLVSELLRVTKAVVVSGNGMAGFGDANDITTEKKLSRLYVCGDKKTDVGGGTGLMAPRVAVCAGHQANQVIRLILGEDK
ncbi:MAG: sulfur carrier protein ThiS adenylyltransferase ThiF [Abditibacteriota bacterium]|nr:sulfur carrier protein ThiS adenylyltransferase ThiF [Abditibacteriota bacterium]